jgi:soluble lytic murein transglycosylase-like protein
MIDTVAPQHRQHAVRLKGVQIQLLRLLPAGAADQLKRLHARTGKGARRPKKMDKTILIATRAYAALRGSLALLGLAALAAVLLLPGRPEMLKHLPPLAAWSLANDALRSPAVTAGGPLQVGADDAATLEREQRAIIEYIARRYRVSDHAVTGFVGTAYRAAAEQGVDPLLVLAVIAIESRYNPVAESTVGAKGLMQVIPKYHLEKLIDHGGEQALLDPYVNIRVGTQILREYQRRLRDTEAALQMYGGAFDEPTSQYANKVLAEKARLEALRQKAKNPQSV